MACKGFRLVATLDWPNSRQVDSGTLKNVTGDKRMNVRDLHKATESMRLEFLTIFASNQPL
eukprot:580395-Pleurochrysis_carterae.AAC.1